MLITLIVIMWRVARRHLGTTNRFLESLPYDNNYKHTYHYYSE